MNGFFLESLKLAELLKPYRSQTVFFGGSILPMGTKKKYLKKPFKTI